MIAGIRNIRQGVSLDIVPSITMATGKDCVTGINTDRVDSSLNVFDKVTPNLTGVLKLNTDFSATEVDNRQVNLSRFSLFFPEKRDFFLRDVSYKPSSGFVSAHSLSDSGKLLTSSYPRRFITRAG